MNKKVRRILRNKSDSACAKGETSLEEYFSFVRHELRNQLLVVREGISQVLDGLAGDDWDKCFEILKRALKSTDKANKLIGELLEADEAKINQVDNKVDNFDKLESDFFSDISHELRTPLTAAKEGISLVLDDVAGKTNQNQRKFLSIAQRNIARIVWVINSLLGTSGGGASGIEAKREPVDVTKLVDEVLETFRSQLERRGITLETSCSSQSYTIYGDRDGVAQAISNLISSALKVTERGKITVAGRDKGGHFEFSVTDTGKGIAANELATIFDKSWQRNQTTEPLAAGIGLALTVTRGIIEAHGGKIWAESEGKGKGSKFTFILPRGLTKQD